MNRDETGRPTESHSPEGAAPGAVFTLPRFALLLAVMLFAWFPDVLSGARSFFTRDFSTFGFPLASFVQQSYRAGEIPLWNPYNFCGVPFLAQWNTMALYPFSAIYVLLPQPWSLNLFNLLHLWLGGVGMFVLARAWLRDDRAAAVSGIGYAFGGMMVSALMWPNNIAALGWLPWVWWLGERAATTRGKVWVGAAFVLALQFLTGAPEITALSWAGLGAIVAFGQERGATPPLRRLLKSSLVFASALLLCAAQLLPFLEMLRLSHRGGNYGSTDWSLAWSGLGNFLVPLFHTVKDRDGIYFQPGQQWVTSYYAGATILCLAILGAWQARSQRARLLTIGALLSLLLALGPHGGLYNLLRAVIPGLGVMRYPIKFIVPLTVLLPLLAGYGLRAWLSGQVNRRSAGGTIAFGLLATAGLLAWSHWQPVPHEDASATLRSGLFSSLAVVLFAGVAAFRGWRRMPEGRWLQPVVLCALMFGDLCLANRGINPVVATRLMQINMAFFEPNPALGESRLMVSPRAHRRLDETVFTTPEAAAQIPRYAQVLNLNLPDRYPKLDGFFSLYLPASVDLLARLEQATNGLPRGLLDFLGVSHTNRASNPAAWDNRPGWLPVATLVSRALFLEREAAWKQLFSEQFEPREQVILNPVAADQSKVTTSASGKIASARYTPQRVEVTTDTTGPMFLVLAQTFHPGWVATLDGQPVSLLPANVAFQAIEVPGGRHDVVLHFRPRSFQFGAWISAATLLGLGLVMVIRRSRGDD